MDNQLTSRYPTPLYEEFLREIHSIRRIYEKRDKVEEEKIQEIERQLRNVMLLLSQSEQERSREPETQDDLTIPDEFPFDMFKEEQTE